METAEPSYAEQFFTALSDFYHNEVVDLVARKVQVFQSFTYGEMTIATLLLLFVVLFVLKWAYEVVR